MLYRASTQDVKSGRISRRYSHIAVVMQFYPRFLAKDSIDEYLHVLAPDRELFTEFKERDRALKDHDQAFAEVRYEERFTVTPDGLVELDRLQTLAKTKDVFLICQCESLQRCHADLLLLLARHKFHATVRAPRVSYPVFEARLRAESV